MSDYSDEESYYDDLAEAWGERGVGGGGGGGAKKIKKKAAPTTVGKQRVGGAAWVGGIEKACPKGCAKKCCTGSKKTPSLSR